MKKEIGLWVDHRKAVIVTIENDVELIREVQSNIENHVRFSDDRRSNSGANLQKSTAEDMRDRQYANHLGRYYEGIISMIRDADTIWIFGPGEAKVELEKQLEKNELGARVLGIDTVDKMTDQQIAAKVRDRFLR